MRKLWIVALSLMLLGCGQQPSRPTEPAAVPSQPGPAASVPASAPDTRPAIVCFGDSLTAGLGAEPEEAYPGVLQRELDRRGYRYRVLNMGESGDTSQDALARVALVAAEKPVFVVLEFGANDGLRGQPVASTRKNLESLIVTLQAAGARPVLAGMTLPPNYGPEYVRSFETVFRDLAAKYKLPIIPFLLAGVGGNSQLMQRDGLHPNPQGYRVVAENVLKTLEPLLQR